MITYTALGPALAGATITYFGIVLVSHLAIGWIKGLLRALD